MATELRCDATHAKIVGVDAGSGPLILGCPDYTIKVEVIAWRDDFDRDGKRPNLRWEAVRRMIEAHTDEPVLERDREADVIELRERRDA